MPVDRGTIEAQLRDIGEGERWWEHQEFRDLPHVLQRTETIRALAKGKLLGMRRPRIRPAPSWLFVITDERLICLRRLRHAREQVDFTPGVVTGLRQGGGIFAAQIVLRTERRRYRVRIAKDDAVRFAAALNQLFPHQAAPPIHPDLEAVAWIPGVARVAALPGVSGLVSKVSMLTSPPLASPEHVARLEARVVSLQAEVERLRNQVGLMQEHIDFMEDLLSDRADARLLAASTGAQRESAG
jgi:hypothetical protein